MSDQLTWTHYRRLLKVEVPEIRGFYIKECIENNWSTRQLERQINSFYYQRLLSSKEFVFNLQIANCKFYDFVYNLSIMKRHGGMRPQDILVLLTLALNKEPSLRNIDISKILGLSQAEVGASISRSIAANLIDTNRNLLKSNFIDFITYGLKYVFPVVPSGIERGVPTAHSAEPLKHLIVSSENSAMVWPCTEGKIQGQGIQPLYHTVPNIALNDNQLYELFALIDAVRIGNAREHTLAIEEIKKRLLKQ